MAPCTDGYGCGQPCYGAAARDPEHQPCLNPALELSVFPTPDAAELEIGDRCATKERSANWWVCGFGPVAGTRTFALIGDSHAGHWRGALANIAFGQGWRGLSITRAGCPFSQAVPDLAPPLGAECAAWNRRVLRWFASHPQVDLVFVSEHSGAGFRARRGQSPAAAAVAGYAAAYRALPPTVKHIVVLRDTPLNTSNSFACVDHAIAHHLRAGIVCAVTVRHALRPDPEVTAAARAGSPRIRVADLTTSSAAPASATRSSVGSSSTATSTISRPSSSATLGPFILRELLRWMASPAWLGAASG